jgi:transcriptional regulator, GntR family
MRATGVGRTSIREALRQLEAEGLVDTVPHRGPVVSTITADEAEQLTNCGRCSKASPAANARESAIRRFWRGYASNSRSWTSGAAGRPQRPARGETEF